MAALVLLFAGCESSSKTMAKNFYGNSEALSNSHCRESIQTVEAREWSAKATMLLSPLLLLAAALPSSAVLVANGGVIVDDEVNANRIAKDCELETMTQDDKGVFANVLKRGSISLISGVSSPIAPPVQVGVD
jgi:hypothetical protein